MRVCLLRRSAGRRTKAHSGAFAALFADFNGAWNERNTPWRQPCMPRPDAAFPRVRPGEGGAGADARESADLFLFVRGNPSDGQIHRRIGGAIDYKSGSSDVTHIPGTMDNSRRGVTLYDTFNLGKSNDYLDLVFRYGRLHNDFSVLGSDNSWVNGNYNDNVETLSAEYGVKKVWNNNNFIEPQLQFQFGHLGSSAYTTSNSTRVYLDGANSIIARAGFRLGHEYKNGIGYFKADLIHEFDGGQDVTLSDQNDSYSSQINKRGTWYDVGFGGTYALNDKCSAYADIERVFGSEVKDWELNVGTKWSF